MNTEEFIDHELRIRMLEIQLKQMNNKKNAALSIAITGFAVPMILKYFGI
jgi:hypothetical protein